MERQFDQILDECLDRLMLRGESVEDCLAAYPEHAAELEPRLRLIAGAVHTYAFTPSQEAKQRGRQRLQEEQRLLEQEEMTRQSRKPAFPLLTEGWRRWATATAALLVFVLAGGTGTVFASRGAVPGDTLYRVKLAAEDVRLAFEFSTSGKAERQLAYAERRTKEIGELVEKGKESRVKEAQDLLLAHLTSARASLAGLSGEDAARLAMRVAASADTSLGALQQAFASAPDASRDAAGRAFATSSQAYGETLERAATQASDRVVIGGPGVLQIFAIDPPAPPVDQVLVEVAGVEAHLIGEGQGRWITISQTPQTFDLLRIAEVRSFLAEQSIPSGSYTRLRFTITQATVLVNGVEHPVRVPSGQVSLVRPFIVEEGKTTVLLLDFDGERSLRMAGQDGYILTPIVQVLVELPGKAERPAKEEERPTPGVPQRKKVEIEGSVEAVTADGIIIRGRLIIVESAVPPGVSLEVGQRVHIDAVVEADGAFRAVAVDVKGQDDKRPGQSPDRPKPNEERPASPPASPFVPTPTLPTVVPTVLPTIVPPVTPPPTRLPPPPTAPPLPTLVPTLIAPTVIPPSATPGPPTVPQPPPQPTVVPAPPTVAPSPVVPTIAPTVTPPILVSPTPVPTVVAPTIAPPQPTVVPPVSSPILPLPPLPTAASLL
ncbi:MAG: DUF4382 domain-containing protein [Chloroflexi bacterium]|nr:DUF4382 domain-containing protein [Chloroflexota bacterium]